MPSNTKTRKLKTTDAAPAESPGPDNVPIGNLYPEPETKIQDNPQAPAWFTRVNKKLIQLAPVRPSSSLDPNGLLMLWTSEGSPGMFNQALSNLMIEHPAFAFVHNPSTPLTVLTNLLNEIRQGHISDDVY